MEYSKRPRPQRRPVDRQEWNPRPIRRRPSPTPAPRNADARSADAGPDRPPQQAHYENVYCNAIQARAFIDRYGQECIKLSIRMRPSELYEALEDYYQRHGNQDWINVAIVPRRSPSKNGETHNVEKWSRKWGSLDEAQARYFTKHQKHNA